MTMKPNWTSNCQLLKERVGEMELCEFLVVEDKQGLQTSRPVVDRLQAHEVGRELAYIAV